MFRFRMTKLPKHQQYNYRPRFWDPEKEELEDRLQKATQRQGGDAEAMKARITDGLRKSYQRDQRHKKSAAMRSNLILLAIIVLLLGASYVFLTAYLPEIADSIQGAGE